MMRAKRPRAPHGSANAGHGAGGAHSRTRSMSDDHLGDDYLLHMDPSLMTERQQLAFLLRKTAQEQSAGDDSPHSHDASSDDDDHDATVRRPRKRIQHAKTSPRHGRKSANSHTQPHQGKATPTSSLAAAVAAAATSRARSSKSAKSNDGDAAVGRSSPRAHANAKTHNTQKPSSSSSSSSSRRLHVKTATSPTASDAADAASLAELDARGSICKPSPSSTSDIAHIGVFDDALGHADFWSLHCALCASQLDAGSEPLFLCQSCDRKYPTQRALGRV